MNGPRRAPFNRGEWEIQRERHRLDRQAPPSSFHLHTMGDVVPEIMKKLGLDGRMWESALDSEWAALVGPQVAAHTRPGRFQVHTLYVFVDSAAWLNELSRYGQSEMLAKLQARFGAEKIKALLLQLDPEG